MDDDLLDTLHLLFLAPRSVQSDFARVRAQDIAALASQGYITTKHAKDEFGRLWRITPPGLTVLNAQGKL